MASRAGRRFSAVLLFVSVLAVAVIVYWLLLKWDKQFDWTQSRANTLAQTSIAVLAEAADELRVTAYAREQNTAVRKAIVQLVERYRRYKPNISLSFVDPDAEPQQVRDRNIKVDGEMLLTLGGVTENVRSLKEQDFTNALQRLLRQGERWLAFMSGHGERKPEGQANHDLGNWVAELRQKGFNIANVNLVESGGVPLNASLAIIAGPQLRWLPGEVEHIVKYLDNGGNLLWLTEPGSDHGLAALAEHLGLVIDGATVVDPLARLVGIDNPTFAIVANYPDHPVLNQFEATTLFPQVTAVIAQSEVNGWQQSAILSSGDQSWLERGDLSGNVRLDDADLPGPVPIAVALQREVTDGDGLLKQQRIIVMGDGDFIANQYVGNAGNLELGVRLINWLSDDDHLIAIPPVERGDRELTLSLLYSQIIAIGFLIVIPALLLLAGSLIWWRRRHRY